MIRISRPTMLIDKQKCQANINRMAAMARKNHVIFRPHFKTHQSAEIGEWFRQAGVNAITVSSVSMAGYFAANGWTDITIAFPVNILEMDEINALSAKISINLLIESPETATFLKHNLAHPTGFFIKIDTGYHRTGVEPSETKTIEAILDIAAGANKLLFKGFLTHTGQTYQAKSSADIRQHHETAGRQMLTLKMTYQDRFPGIILSTGDTPSCSLFDPMPGIDEIRPGNFVFYDLMQSFIGSCEITDIAVSVICPVVALHPERNETVIYGGAVHLSKEYYQLKEEKVYGLAVSFTGETWDCSSPVGFLTALSQEHGIIKLSRGNTVEPGQLIAVLPVHSCLTAHLMKDGTFIINQ